MLLDKRYLTGKGFKSKKEVKKSQDYKNQVKLIDLSPRSHIQADENGDIDEL